MSEQRKEDSISPQPDQEKNKASTELTDEELKQASGGKVHLSDIQITRKIDKASPL